MTREEKDTELLTLIKESRSILGDLTRATKRSNEIKKAADEHAKGLPIRFDKVSYIMGAKWADENPQSPWINAKDDLPYNHDELWVMTGRLIHTKKVLVALIDGTVRLLSMLYDEVNDKWEWESKILKDKFIFWTPIPEPPKE